jgi:hypothetical protein
MKKELHAGNAAARWLLTLTVTIRRCQKLEPRPTNMTSNYINLDGPFIVESDRCRYSEIEILADYTYVSRDGNLLFGRLFCFAC